jgi:hypothetical protein
LNHVIHDLRQARRILMGIRHKRHANMLSWRRTTVRLKIRNLLGEIIG